MDKDFYHKQNVTAKQKRGTCFYSGHTDKFVRTFWCGRYSEWKPRIFCAGCSGHLRDSKKLNGELNGFKT